MSTDTQKSYIADLVVLKTKEFKEVKELISSSGIVSENAQLVEDAKSIAEITDALTDYQASQFIDLLISSEKPNRGVVYSKNRIEKTVSLVDSIKETISNWDFK